MYDLLEKFLKEKHPEMLNSKMVDDGFYFEYYDIFDKYDINFVYDIIIIIDGEIYHNFEFDGITEHELNSEWKLYLRKEKLKLLENE